MMAISGARGCGKSRVPGGIYFGTMFSEQGIPLNMWLFDPPWILVDEEGKLWQPGWQGIQIMPRPGHPDIHDAYDWIGAEFYEFFPDYWEEGKRMEFSRRVQPSFEFDKLTKESQMIGVHPKGYFWHRQETLDLLYRDSVTGTGMDFCPHMREDHKRGSTELCIRLLWQVVGRHEGEGIVLVDREMPQKRDEGQDPTFIYHAGAIGKDYPPCTWQPAAVYHLPIHVIQIVRDPVDKIHDKRYDEIMEKGCAIPVEVVDE